MMKCQNGQQILIKKKLVNNYANRTTDKTTSGAQNDQTFVQDKI